MDTIYFVLGLLAVGYPLGIGFAAIGSGFGLGRAIGSATESIARQPEAFTRIFILALVGAGMIEALTIYALIVPFIAKGQILQIAAKAAGVEL